MSVKPCQCQTHLMIEAQEPEKSFIECLGHGEGCPCTERTELHREEEDL